MAAVRPRRRTYLDYNATAPVRPEARAAVLSAMETTGNPSSVHAEGRAARRIVEDARAEVARIAGVAPRCVTFVSSATEAANLALNPLLGVEPGGAPIERLIAGAGEHLCVLAGHRFPVAETEFAPLREDGRVDLDWLEAACRRPGRALLALQGANNETGVVQPVAEAAAMVHAAGGVVFCDAVQLAGRASCDIAELGAVNIGATLIRGGGQERGARAGTENVAAIAGFGAAARSRAAERDAEAARLLSLRERFAETVKAIAPDAVIFGESAPMLPKTLSFAAPSVEAATLMISVLGALWALSRVVDVKRLFGA